MFPKEDEEMKVGLDCSAFGRSKPHLCINGRLMVRDDESEIK